MIENLTVTDPLIISDHNTYEDAGWTNTSGNRFFETTKASIMILYKPNGDLLSWTISSDDVTLNRKHHIFTIVTVFPVIVFCLFTKIAGFVSRKCSN